MSRASQGSNDGKAEEEDPSHHPLDGRELRTCRDEFRICFPPTADIGAEHRAAETRRRTSPRTVGGVGRVYGVGMVTVTSFDGELSIELEPTAVTK